MGSREGAGCFVRAPTTPASGHPLRASRLSSSLDRAKPFCTVLAHSSNLEEGERLPRPVGDSVMGERWMFPLCPDYPALRAPHLEEGERGPPHYFFSCGMAGSCHAVARFPFPWKGCPQGGVGECRANKDAPRHPRCPQGGVGECRANKDTPCHARVPDEP